MENVVIREMEKGMNKNEVLAAKLAELDARLPEGYKPDDLITVYGIT